VIAKEKELIAIVEPIEIDLAGKQEVVDKEKIMVTRRAAMPERTEKLKALEVVIADDFLLTLTDEEFNGFLNQETAKYLAAQKAKMDAERMENERKQREEQEKLEVESGKIEAEKQAMERQKQHEIEIKEAEEKAAEKARFEVIEKAKREEEERKQVILKQEAEKKAEKEKLEATKKLQNFLAKHEYKDDGTFLIQNDLENDKVVLYKKLGEFKI
jgi:reticulocyte-binding protein